MVSYRIQETTFKTRVKRRFVEAHWVVAHFCAESFIGALLIEEPAQVQHLDLYGAPHDISLDETRIDLLLDLCFKLFCGHRVAGRCKYVRF